MKTVSFPSLCLFTIFSFGTICHAKDSDNDGISDQQDNCPTISNSGQWDKDKDGIGNDCDRDIDGDGFSNLVEKKAGTKAWDKKSFPRKTSQDDLDGDSIHNSQDNCPNIANTKQQDKDKDGLGNECDDDIDGDGYSNAMEKSRGTKVWNKNSYPQQKSLNDPDGDGINNNKDNCPFVANAGQWDKDKDGIGNKCDKDIDGDGFDNSLETSYGTKAWDKRSHPAYLQSDLDGDGIADKVDRCPHSKYKENVDKFGCITK